MSVYSINHRFNNYKKFLNSYIDLTLYEWELFQSKIDVQKYKKGEIVLYAGDVSNSFIFINSGLMRGYILDELGHDYTWHIYFNDKDSVVVNLIATDYDSFSNQIPSKMFIEVLKDSEVFIISYDDIEYLYSKIPAFEKFGRKVSGLFYSYSHNKIINQLVKSAEDRFEDFMKATPYLLEKVPQYHIATYIGITPQSLSRLKRNSKFSKKH